MTKNIHYKHPYEPGDLVKLLIDIKNAGPEIYYNKGDIVKITEIAFNGEGLMFNDGLGVDYRKVKLFKKHREKK